MVLGWGFPGGSELKTSACNAGDLGSIPGLGRPPWRRKWQPTPVFLPGESHGQRSPWGRKELDTTEPLHFTLACRSGLQKTLLFLLESSRSGLNFWPEICFPSLCGELHSRSERLETAIGLCSWILILLDDPITVILVKTDVVSLCLVLLSAPCFPFV